MRQLGAIILAFFATVAAAQVPEDEVARLTSPNESERSSALTALGALKAPDEGLLDVIAERLLDQAESVRVMAAYTLAAVAAKVGCKADSLPDCKALKRVIETPKVSKRVSPRYPEEALRKRIQGQVRLEFLIRADGVISNIQVVDGPPPISEAAVECVRQLRYDPARRKGTAVPFVMPFTMHFRLK